jgi:Bacterial regulatory protein, arsR family
MATCGFCHTERPDAHRREILDALIGGEKAVGAIVKDLSMSQPQVSKHLRVLNEVGTCQVPCGGASSAVPPGTRAPPAVARVVGQVRAGME